jgi:hypothetical protein
MPWRGNNPDIADVLVTPEWSSIYIFPPTSDKRLIRPQFYSTIAPMSQDTPQYDQNGSCGALPSHLTTEKGTPPVSTDASPNPAAQADPSVSVPRPVVTSSDEEIRRILPNYVIPPCFARPPSGSTYTAFQPMHLTSIGQYLNKGFPQRQPPSNVDPHPFVSHDVTEEDWLT